MDKFKKYAEILKNFSKDMEMWKACEEDEIADAKEKYTSKALPEQLEKIKSVYEKRYKKVRQIALEQVESETKSIKQRNQGKFKPDFVDLELLKELNAISAAGIPMTESEVEAYCKRAIASRSSFCVRAVQNIAKQIQPTMFVGCGTRADQGDFECKIKNRVPVSLPCVPDRDGNSANRKVIVLSFIASLL